ncbi:Predicted PurR-regulated permease PerM [Filimonas lacunae]|uniref:Predicted PurR-regulated permease PerM n=1 Tax=Filimonas lacunae TaxID=477680 RepID=A0A173MQZ5_9BACT|nr:AI-2E family transporter [Filimonas lacunae]BAV09758.1 permease [Filimonas lacunae]SIS78555.1 Predicted PurR-regulated permease PerM [Filimonas lacunae]
MPLTSPQPFYMKLSHTLISIVLIGFIMYVGHSILVPLAFASLFSIILMTPCDFLEKRKVPRTVAAALSVLLFIIIIGIILYFIFSQLVSFQNDLPKLGVQLQGALVNLENSIQERFHISGAKMREFLNSASSQTLSHTSTVVGTTVSTLSSAVIYMVLIPIYTFLLLLYRGIITRFFIRSFQEEHSPAVRNIMGKTRHVIKSYIAGLIIEMIIVAIMNCTGFFILGVKYALMLGVIAALLNLIPYVGIFTACILSLLITFTTNSPATVLGVAIVLVIVHIIDSNILLPRVVGSKVKINALVTIVGVLVGSAIWGIAGMFLAIPIMAILKVIFDGIESTQAWGILLGDETSNTTQVIIVETEPTTEVSPPAVTTAEKKA